MTIYVRDDDVLIDSSQWDDPVSKFKQVHSWCCEGGFIHRPAILIHNVVKDGTRGISEFPEVWDFIAEQAQNGTMEPEIHGWEHIDYGKKKRSQVIEEIAQARSWIETKWRVKCSKWYTPWGASQEHLWEAAEELRLTLVDCSRINKLEGRYGIVQRLTDGEDISFLDNQEIFFHWWNGGARLLRVARTAKYGSWANAQSADPKLFR